MAGSGGLVSVPFSEASTSNTSEAYARTGSGDDAAGNARKIDVNSLLVSAGHGAKFDSWLDSTNASLVSVSGARTTNTVDARSEAHIGTTGYVEADNITLQARKEVLNAYSSHEKVRRVFGERRLTSLEEGLGQMAAWVKAHGSRASHS